MNSSYSYNPDNIFWFFSDSPPLLYHRAHRGMPGRRLKQSYCYPPIKDDWKACVTTSCSAASLTAETPSSSLTTVLLHCSSNLIPYWLHQARGGCLVSITISNLFPSGLISIPQVSLSKATSSNWFAYLDQTQHSSCKLLPIEGEVLAIVACRGSANPKYKGHLFLLGFIARDIACLI